MREGAWLMNEKTLTPRLRAVCRLVPRCETCADIGCDHAQVAIYLAESRRVADMTAADVNRGPLERAMRAVRAAGMDDKIKCVLSDGLENIPPQDCVIIAGMGGDLIADILSRAEWTRRGERTLVLQPMTAAYRLREFLCSSGYEITAETYAAEREKLYTVICARPGRQEAADMSELYLSRAGEGDSLAGEYAERVIATLTGELDGLRRAAVPNEGAIAHREEAIALLRARFERRG